MIMYGDYEKKNPCRAIGVASGFRDRDVLHGLRGSGSRKDRCGRPRAVRYQRRKFHVRERFVVLLRHRFDAGGKRGVPSHEYDQAGRCGPVDGDSQRAGVCCRQQFGRHIRHRSRYVRAQGNDRGTAFAPLHPFPERRKGLCDRLVRLAHHDHQSENVRNHRPHRREDSGQESAVDRADGAVRRLRFHELLVVR